METIAFLQQFALPSLDAVALAITNTGSAQAYIALLLITYLAIDAKLGQRLGIYFLIGYYLNFWLKGRFDTPRPYTLDPSVARSEEAIATGTGPGFPSGHAQASVMFWAYLAFYARRVWVWLGAVLIITLISLSRIYLGVHIPLDILGGLAIGALFVLLVLIFDRLVENVQIPAKALVVSLGLLGPLLVQLFFATLSSELLTGGLAAFITGPALLPHRTDVGIVNRIATALLGLTLVFAVLIASSLLLPEEIKRNALAGFLRYLLIGYTGVLFTPWLAKRFGLIPKKRIF